MKLNKEGCLILSKEETGTMLTMAENLLHFADLNELKTSGFVRVEDSFVHYEINLLLDMLYVKQQEWKNEPER